MFLLQVDRALAVLLSVLETPTGADQLSLLLLEPSTGPLLYPLFLRTDSSPWIEKIARLLTIVAKTERASEKNKSYLRLKDYGFAGMCHLLSIEKDVEINGTVASSLCDLILLLDRPCVYQDLVSFLFLIQISADVDVKIEICRRVISLFYMTDEFANSLAKCLCWEEAILGLLKPLKKQTDENYPDFYPSVPSISAQVETESEKMGEKFGEEIGEKIGEEIGVDIAALQIATPEEFSESMFDDYFEPNVVSVPISPLIDPTSLIVQQNSAGAGTSKIPWNFLPLGGRSPASPPATLKDV